MSDSTALLVVSIVAPFAIGGLLFLWLYERANRTAFQKRPDPGLRNDHIHLASKIADGSAHPLAAWRLGAGLDVESVADALRISARDITAVEDGDDCKIDKTSLAALIAANSASAPTTHKPLGAPVMGSADAPNAAGADGMASGSSVSDGGGGAM